MPRHLTLLAALCALTAGLSACGSPKKSSSSGTTPAGANACAKTSLPLVNAGQLTVATDKPAYPP